MSSPRTPERSREARPRACGPRRGHPDESRLLEGGHLQRRLLLWFGATILLTGLTVMSVLWVTRSLAGGRDDWRGMRVFVSEQFERAWDDPARVSALASSIAKHFRVGVVVRGRGESAPRAAAGPECRRPWLVAPVERRGVTVGQVSVCSEARGVPGLLRIVLPLVFAGAVLWAASGFLARRPARPLYQAAVFAEAMKNGRLDARVPVPQSRGEARALALAINAMAERIEAQVEGQRRLLATVSHEIRTPLARIRLLTEMARGKGATEKVLDDLDAEAVEIDALVGELLASSKLDFGVLGVRELDAGEAAARALERAGAPLEVLDVDSDAGYRVVADPTLLARALANLLANARHHGGGVDRLAVREEAGRVSFSVLDRGPGIDEEAAAKVFEAFYQGEPRGGAGALGLGLALVKRIAEAQGGDVFARPRPGGGAEVGLRLPRAGAAREADGA